MRRVSKNTIFNQLVLSIIFPVLLVLVLLAIYDYSKTLSYFNENNNIRNEIVTNEIKSILDDQDFTISIIEKELDKKLEEISRFLILFPFKNTNNIENINLYELQDRFSVDYDIYIINREGTIINTTFKKDLGLNLFQFDNQHKQFLIDVLNSSEFFNEKFSIENKTKRIKKYTYESTTDKNYIIELGAYSNEADSIFNYYKEKLNTVSEKFPVGNTNADLFYGLENPVSYNKDAAIDNSFKYLYEKAFKEKRNIDTIIRTGNAYIQHHYIYITQEKSSLYHEGILRIVSDQSDEYQKLVGNFILSIILYSAITIILILLLYRNSRKIAKPIQNLDEKIKTIKQGNFEERVNIKGSTELESLSNHFNEMVIQIQSFYDDLEEKVLERTVKIEEQKEEIIRKNEAIKEYTDQLQNSISYAKNIQNSILISEDVIQKHLPGTFIYFEPRDIVSGDFYYISRIDNKVIIAAVDCTGHGIPGAFMSFIGYTLLNEIVKNNRITDPSEILKKLHLGVFYLLQQNRKDLLIKDGMDVALCVLDVVDKKIEFSGAKNPVYIVHNDELEVIRGDLDSIGGFSVENKNMISKKFTTHQIKYKPGSQIFLFSDGFWDQFGVDDFEKFGRKKFRELLIETSKMPLDQQKEYIRKTFIEWKGNNEQTDDVLVIGIPLK